MLPLRSSSPRKPKFQLSSKTPVYVFLLAHSGASHDMETAARLRWTCQCTGITWTLGMSMQLVVDGWLLNLQQQTHNLDSVRQLHS